MDELPAVLAAMSCSLPNIDRPECRIFFTCPFWETLAEVNLVLFDWEWPFVCPAESDASEVDPDEDPSSIGSRSESSEEEWPSFLLFASSTAQSKNSDKRITTYSHV